MEKEAKKSVFMQMHDGERTGEGSFNVGLQKLFYIATITNKRKLVDAFPEFFGEEVPKFGIHADHGVAKSDRNVFIQDGLSDKKMNIHLHLKDATLQNLEVSLRHSEETISRISLLIHEMLQKHQDNTQRENNGQPCAFRFLLQFQKYNIEVLSSQSREASTDVNDLYDRL